MKRLTSMANWSLYRALVRTKELIATEERWCQGVIAMVEGDVPLADTIDIDTDLGIVCRMCVQGAARVATLRGPVSLGELTGILDDAVGALFPGESEVWEKVNREGDDPHVAVNDGLGFAAVHQMLDLAIEANKP